MEIIQKAGAIPAGVVIALDRMEKGQGELSATQEVARDYQIPVIAVASLKDLMAYIKEKAEFAQYKDAIAAYREKYGV